MSLHTLSLTRSEPCRLIQSYTLELYIARSLGSLPRYALSTSIHDV